MRATPTNGRCSPCPPEQQIDKILDSDEIRLFQQILKFVLPESYPTEHEIRVIITGDWWADFVTDVEISKALSRRWWRTAAERSLRYSNMPLLYHWWLGERPNSDVVHYYLLDRNTASPIDDDYQYQCVAHTLNQTLWGSKNTFFWDDAI